MVWGGQMGGWKIRFSRVVEMMTGSAMYPVLPLEVGADPRRPVLGTDQHWPPLVCTQSRSRSEKSHWWHGSVTQYSLTPGKLLVLAQQPSDPVVAILPGALGTTRIGLAVRNRKNN